MSITLEDAKSLPLNGTATVEFISRPGVIWSVVGRYPDDERHPERVRLVLENAERGESYITEAHLEKVLNWSTGKEDPRPIPAVPIDELKQVEPGEQAPIDSGPVEDATDDPEEDVILGEGPEDETEAPAPKTKKAK